MTSYHDTYRPPDDPLERMGFEEYLADERRAGRDDNREGDDWNKCQHPVKAMHGSIGTFKCVDCGAVMTFLDAVGGPEPPAQPQQEPQPVSVADRLCPGCMKPNHKCMCAML